MFGVEHPNLVLNQSRPRWSAPYRWLTPCESAGLQDIVRQKSPWFENRDDRFFAGGIDDGKLHAALLNVHDVFSGILVQR
jgi:hypothetical protein